METVQTDICVIGAGAGGLSVAAGSAQMGAKVILVEAGLMGGDCLNYGCVPSKALIAAAEAAYKVRHLSRFGIQDVEPVVDWAKVRCHIKTAIDQIAHHDSQERFENMGVQVIRESGAFLDPNTLRAGDFRVKAKKFVLATGSQPIIPSIPGLDKTPFLTNQTIFDNNQPIKHLIVIGGGPIGLELAQAVKRLGADVTVLEASRILGKEDSELTALVREKILAEGVKIIEGATVENVLGVAGKIQIRANTSGKNIQVKGSHILVATGRKPTISGLELEKAGIEFGSGGVSVDRRLRTTNKNVFALGDVVGAHNYTHAASYQAGVIIRNVLFRIPARTDYRAMPRVTFTKPELAQIGMTFHEAKVKFNTAQLVTIPFSENDRAQVSRDTHGVVKVVTSKRGKILGVGIVGDNAGEIIQTWAMPIAKGMNIKKLTELILPYPTLGEINKRAAGAFFAPKLFSTRTKRLVKFLLSFG
ncbi:MAG: FAD-dependent oxidoreductase [Rhodospirillaceae bacterium]